MTATNGPFKSGGATDFVVCDDPMVALGAHRLLPPWLDDPSIVRTRAGYLTSAEAEAATVRYHAAAIVASRPMLVDDLPTYLTWVRQHYRRVPSPVPGAQVYHQRSALSRNRGVKSFRGGHGWWRGTGPGRKEAEG